ncbi:putative replication protein [Groundnut rosette assistor virus]|uniref:Replication protein n=1 Tax=Groundnut rosette assistor virus TaxID=33761 RepID=A0AAE6R3Y6_9VIRU|nr:putative replication protein [Groundnut rosette assistor virus]QGY99243.1 putative replication protein [Groundnut rosette assistor virus]
MNYFLSCVLFFSFFLLFQTSSNGAPISRGGTLIPTIYLDGLLGFNTSLLWEGKAAPGACTCPKTQLLTEHTYTELLRATWLKGSYDSLSLMQSLGDGLLAGSTCLLDESRKWASLTLEWFIWAVLALYFSIIWRTICIVLGLIFNHSLLIFATGLAVTSSVLVGWVLRKIFAILQMSILSALIPLTRGIWNLIRMRKRTTKEIGERAVDGFLTFKVRQDPPKKSVLQIQYSSGSHAGYATCIRLLNGRNALITAAHVVDPKQGPVNVVSPRTGNKIPWSEFQKRCVLCSTKNDQVICEGPPEWESLLGCKGVHFVPATNVSKSKCSLFALGDDGWYLRNAELAGAEFLPSGKPTGYMTLLCNTEAGDSGAPLFSGKSLVGVHIGYHLDLNSNRACPILPMRGVTLPDYVCETTAPTGRIFDQELIDMVSAAVKDIRKAEESLKAKAGRLWADEVEFEDEYFEAKPRFSNRKRSGNGKRGTDRGTTGEGANPASPIPTGDTTGKSALDQVVKALVDKISVKGIEEAVINGLKAKALKRGPQRKRSNNRGKNKPTTSSNTSSPSTTGKYVPPQMRAQQSPALQKSGSSPSTTTPPRRENQNGVGKSFGNIPRWVRKPAASGGRSSVQMPN